MIIISQFVQKELSALQTLARDCRVYVPNGREELLLLAKDGAQLVGFAAWQCVLDEASLLGIAVAENQRGQGIAGKLLQAGFAQLADYQQFFLEVREGNVAAIALYRRFGFDVIARRKGYYGDEDALVMRKQRLEF